MGARRLRGVPATRRERRAPEPTPARRSVLCRRRDDPERIADLTRDLPPERQTEVLDFIEFLRARRSAAPVRRGSLEELHAALSSAEPAGVDESEWSPFEIEPTVLRDVEG